MFVINDDDGDDDDKSGCRWGNIILSESNECVEMETENKTSELMDL